MTSTENDNLSFDMPKSQSNTIKVIGVGGGGSNAVNHMYQQNTKGVDFVICNTDAQALENSPVPNKIQLGASLTSGLGAGANPEVGEAAAKESLEELSAILSTQTKMVFITAGMGGGTGTGAAPIIAKLAKEMDILTVGIVTMPFQFEGRMRTQQAQKGVDELRKNVDSLIVINNNKLREVYGNLGFKAGFSKADEVLSTASRGIAEVITHHYTQNIDLHDARTVLANSGTAIMGSAKESGDQRAKNAIVKALDSPLLNDNKITGAKNVLLLIISGQREVTLDEIGEINDFIQTEAGYDANIIMGVGEDESLQDEIAITVVATGFAPDQQSNITDGEPKIIKHTLDPEQKATYEFDQKEALRQDILSRKTPETPVAKAPEQKIVHELGVEEEEVKPTFFAPSKEVSDYLNNLEVEFEEVKLPTPETDITNINIDEIEVTDVKTVTPETPAATDANTGMQMDLLFDMEVSAQNTQTPPAVEATSPAVENTVEAVAEEKRVVFSLEESVDDFINNIEVVDFEIVEAPKETSIQEPAIIKHTLEEVTDDVIDKIEVVDPIEVKPTPRESVIRHTLEDFDIQPTIKNASRIDVNAIDVNNINVVDHQVVEAPKEEVADAAMNITLKTATTQDPAKPADDFKEASPMDATISELRQMSEKRREKMKNFNYKFMNNVSQNVDEIEKQPAYKRMGVDLDNTADGGPTQSRTSLSIDDNDEIQLRSNNSFLHDNVD